jgi:hypothetical protein
MAITKGTAATGIQSSASGTSVSATFSAAINSLIVINFVIDTSNTSGPASGPTFNTITGMTTPAAFGSPVAVSAYFWMQTYLAYATSALSSVTLTASYTPQSGDGDAVLAVQSYTGTAATSGTPSAGVGNTISATASGSSVAPSVTLNISSNNSLAIAACAIGTGTFSSMTAGSGFTMDASQFNTNYEAGGIETATAAGTTPSKTVNFTSSTGTSAGGIKALELLVASGTNYTGSGSISITGAATTTRTAVYVYAGSGSVAVSGAAAAAFKLAYVGGGSLALAGAAVTNQTAVYAYAGGGSLAVTGAAVGSQTAAYAYAGGGALSVAGIAVTNQTAAYAYGGSGSVTLSGTAVTSQTGRFCLCWRWIPRRHGRGG